MPRRTVLLAQLPIPPAGLEPIRGNVPLAPAYLKMLAELRGLGRAFDIEILPTAEANGCGDQALVAAILARRPWLVGFTCYLWNVERTVWIAERLKHADPEIKILVGGPEITADNAWALSHSAVDFAAIGEGEQTFAELLGELERLDRPQQPIAGLFVRQGGSELSAGGPLTILNGSPHDAAPPFRKPLPRLDEISSPYLCGILDAADEQMLLLETIRGCVFKCKFCYYPKSYDDLYFLSEEKIVANLEHARRRGASEVVLLDPTLNQRRDFARFLRLLARENPDQQFTYFGELRAEGITSEIAPLLREANFTEVEIGLQSIDPTAMKLMDRNNHLRSFERGARAMLDEGLRVKVDLIIGLPGDTMDSVRRGLDYVHSSGLYTQVQVFNLAVLPGTAFRQEAEQLGLVYQNRPPYYVLQTPTLDIEQIYELMEEAEELFETEFDPLPPPKLDVEITGPLGLQTAAVIDLDATNGDSASHLPPAERQSQAFSLWLRCSDFHVQRKTAANVVSELLNRNPHTTLQIVLEPTGAIDRLTTAALESLREACYRAPSYLDKFYSVLPGRSKGAKRVVVALSSESERTFAESQRDRLEEYATLATLPSQLAAAH